MPPQWDRDLRPVVSHDTALGFHGLSDLLPDRVHLTVPPGFRKPAPVGVVLHRAWVPPEDVRQEHGFQVTTVERTLRDVAAARLAGDLLEQAVDAALHLGEITARQAEALREEARGKA